MLLHASAETSADELQRIKATFLDANGDGKMHQAELKFVLRGLLPNFTEHDLDELFLACSNHGGAIDLCEFFDWIYKTDEHPTASADQVVEIIAKGPTEAIKCQEDNLASVCEEDVSTQDEDSSQDSVSTQDENIGISERPEEPPRQQSSARNTVRVSAVKRMSAVRARMGSRSTKLMDGSSPIESHFVF